MFVKLDALAPTINRCRSVSVISRDSANTLFDQTIATFDDDGGAYNQADAGGFIKLNALRMRIAETARRKRAK